MDEPREDMWDYLLRKGYISQEQYDEIRFILRMEGSDLASILFKLGLNPRDVYEARAMELQQPFVDLTIYRSDQSALDAVPEHIVRRHKALPIKKDGNVLYVAMADTSNISADEDLRLASRCQVRGVLAVPEHIEEAIRRHYGEKG